ncbi:MAG: hypothetical protein AB8B93_20735 [Pseudomonadales bacterium]
MTYKVFQWASGGIGAHTTKVALSRDSLDLVGLHVHAADKVGQDAGELAGLGAVGIAATNDIQAIIDSDADVVIHTPLPSMIAGADPLADLEDFCTLLAAGKNVITVVGYLYPKAHGAEVEQRLQQACLSGGSSFHSTGLNPGWLGDLLPLTLSGLCEHIDHIHVLEISHFDSYASPEIMFNSMGFNNTPEQHAKLITRQKRWLDSLFAESLLLVADGLRLGVSDISSHLETQLAQTDLEVAAGTVRKGTVAAQHWRWSGMASSGEVIAHETVWRIHPDAAPDWPTGDNRITFKGKPNINLSIERDFGFMDNAGIATGAHAMNAIPYVVDAQPGIRTFLDLPWIFWQQ